MISLLIEYNIFSVPNSNKVQLSHVRPLWHGGNGGRPLPAPPQHSQREVLRGSVVLVHPLGSLDHSFSRL